MSSRQFINKKITPFAIDKKLTNYDKSKFHIICIPYAATVTYIKGSEYAPQAILKASHEVEFYDIQTEQETYLKGISLCEIEIEDDIKKIWNKTSKEVKKSLEKGKFLVILGGEHTITHGAIMGCKELYPDICVLQIDAHGDLRKEYQGNPFNHACALRHAFNKNIPIVQVGIRSLTKEEHRLIRDNPDKIRTFLDTKEEINVKEVINSIQSKNVYITIDLDGFAPSVFPHVGTPEPGGLEWYEVIQLLQTMFSRFNIIAADIVELAPNKYSTLSDFSAAKLLYKLLSFKFTS